MSWRNSTSRYGSISIALHWTMLLLIAAVYACIELRTSFPRGSDIREGLKTWHFTLGICVLLLVFFRAVMHFIGEIPSVQRRC